MCNVTCTDTQRTNDPNCGSCSPSHSERAYPNVRAHTESLWCSLWKTCQLCVRQQHDEEGGDFALFLAHTCHDEWHTNILIGFQASVCFWLLFVYVYTPWNRKPSKGVQLYGFVISKNMPRGESVNREKQWMRKERNLRCHAVHHTLLRILVMLYCKCIRKDNGCFAIGWGNGDTNNDFLVPSLRKQLTVVAGTS